MAGVEKREEAEGLKPVDGKLLDILSLNLEGRGQQGVGTLKPHPHFTQSDQPASAAR